MDRRQLLFGASALRLVTNLNLNHPLIAQVGNSVMGSRRLSDRERARLRGPVKTCSDFREDETESNCEAEYSLDGRQLVRQLVWRMHPRVAHIISYKWVYSYDGMGRLIGITRGYEETHQVYDEQGKKIGSETGPLRSDVTDTFHCDEQGRPTRIRTVPPNQVGFTVMLAAGMLEVTEEGGSLSAGGSVTTRYNDDDQPIESLIHDAQGELLTQIVYNYANGLLVNKTLVIVRENLEATRQLQKGFSEEELRAILARRKALLGELVGLRMERSYIYDDDRVIRRRTQMGNFRQDESKTYNEQGDANWTVTIQSGSLEPGEPILRVKRSEFRYLYQYDSHGNWTERTTINTDRPDNPNTQRRTLAYYSLS
jgi:hypothetical protein